jgi:ABC-type lipoprotein release transport system permease subunit
VLSAIALVVTIRLVEGLLCRVSAFHPTWLAMISAVLALVAILLGLFPSLRAAPVDPIQVLCAE